MSDYPYADRLPVNRVLPEAGRARQEVLARLRTMAKEEDAFWETGKCSATMYSGDHDHYAFLLRDGGLRDAQYFFLTEWSGGKYMSPGVEGSRSGGREQQTIWENRRPTRPLIL